jgi:DNA-directed RNA polymerase specialized sigma24 family protein
MAPQEIAGELGMKPGTVRVLIHRASKLLRTHLEAVLKEKEREGDS